MASARSEDGTPAGMLAFFGGKVGCPSGWAVATNAQGRAVVAVQYSQNVGVTVGNPMGNAAAESHIHSFKTSVDLPYKSVSLASPCSAT